jgi:hypothetical protein
VNQLYEINSQGKIVTFRQTLQNDKLNESNGSVDYGIENVISIDN